MPRPRGREGWVVVVLSPVGGSRDVVLVSATSPSRPIGVRCLCASAVPPCGAKLLLYGAGLNGDRGAPG